MFFGVLSCFVKGSQGGKGGVRLEDELAVCVGLGARGEATGVEQQARLFDVGGLLAAEEFPVHGSSIGDLDERRYVEYFERVLRDPETKYWRKEDWQQMLFNRNFLVGDDAASSVCSYFAYALFAKRPGLRLPKAKARLTVYPGEDKDHHTDHDETLDAPFVGFLGENLPHEYGYRACLAWQVACGY